jgi:hypothetical protein
VLKLTGFLSWRKALTCRTMDCCYCWETIPPNNLPYEKDFGWMVFWELNPEMLGSLRLTASASFLEGKHYFGWRPPWFGKAGCGAFELYPGICLTTEGKHGKPVSYSWVVRYSLPRLGCLFRDSSCCPAEHQFTTVTRWELQSVLCRHNCLPSCRTERIPCIR